MAKEEHVQVARRGTAALRAWRKTRRGRLDLSGADLSGAKLAGSDLTGANLFETNLSTADLRGARFTGADLTYADLSTARLQEAQLTKAKMMGANLVAANLSRAVAVGVNLNQADLGDAKAPRVNLAGADLSMSDCPCVDLTGANLDGADLSDTKLQEARFVGATLRRADLSRTFLVRADFTRADMSGAKLIESDLSRATLRRTILRHADLTAARFLETDLRDADLTGCRVYGVSAWNVRVHRTIQDNLVISPNDEPTITVDQLEVAQFIYLLIRNQKIRNVIDTITSKVVLILGRFTPERKRLLDALREELRRRDFVPVLFDFDVPAHRNITETVTLLARMSRFIIADLTSAKSLPQELQAIVPDLDAVPLQPLLQGSQRAYAMFEDFRGRNSVLPIVRYKNERHLLRQLANSVIAPAERRRALLERARRLGRSAADLLDEKTRKRE